jgi:hypothetical protein
VARSDDLVASLRAALTQGEEEDSARAESVEQSGTQERPQRPDGLFFRGPGKDDVTVSAPGTQPEMDRATRPAVEGEVDAIEQSFASGTGADSDEMLRTSESTSLDFLDSTLARPPKLSDAPPPPDTGENPVADMSSEGADFEEEVIIADDLAEMIDNEEEHPPATDQEAPEEEKKRSVPPPVPRQ